MLEGRKFRLGQRVKARQLAGTPRHSVLTPEDEENLDAFSRKLNDVVRLLRAEIDAISQGRLDDVTELFSEKAALVKWIEMKMPIIEPFLDHERAKSYDLSARLSELKKQAVENGEIIARTAGTVGAIIREFDKVSNRHSLSGLYGKSGKPVSGSLTSHNRVNREF